MLPTPIPEEAVIEIAAVYTFFHFHFASGYVFRGERHPFWEMVYVKSGQVDIGADDDVHMLGGGDVIFHRPDEFHSIWANYAHAPELIVVSFACDSPAMRAFERRRLRVTPGQQALLQMLLGEAERTFSTSLEEGEKCLNSGHTGGGYSLRLLLTQFLMDVLQSGNADPPVRRRCLQEPDEATAAVIDDLMDYMKHHIRGELCFEDLCRRVGMSSTAVKQLFRRYFDASPMACYEMIRMGAARRMLRENGGDVAAVAFALGFSSPSYFSTRFRHVSGMSPREYLNEIRERE